MKFLHTSDWHLGAKLGDFSRLSEQSQVLKEIREIAETEAVDFIIIAGDIFDNFNPPNEAVELLYRELKLMAANGNRPVIAIAGNHDSPDRIEAPDPLAAECGIFFAGYPDFQRSRKLLETGIVVDYPEKGVLIISIPEQPQVRILLTPYANENRLRTFIDGDKETELSKLLSGRWTELAERYCDEEGVNLLTAHLFMTAPGKSLSEPEEERSILHPGGLELVTSDKIPRQIQYTALGHLHRYSEICFSPNAVSYSGSPLAFGLSEQEQQKSVNIVEIEPGGKPVIKNVVIGCGRKIYRRFFADVDSAVEWLTDNPNCYVELVIACDMFLSAEQRKRLYGCHDGITAVIPQSRGRSVVEDDSVTTALPDLTESLEGLFSSYFRHSKGTEPDEALLELFREIAAVNEEAE